MCVGVCVGVGCVCVCVNVACACYLSVCVCVRAVRGCIIKRKSIKYLLKLSVSHGH